MKGIAAVVLCHVFVIFFYNRGDRTASDIDTFNYNLHFTDRDD